VDAAYRVFARDGFEAARIVDITAEAGVALGSFYSYFTSKEELFREIALQVVDDLSGAPHRDPDNDTGDPVRDITYAVREYIRVCVGYGRITSSIQQVSHVDAELRAYRQEVTARNAARGERYIRRLQREGIVPADIDPAAVAPVLQTMVVHAVYEHLVLYETGAQEEELANTLSQIWLRAIGIGSGPPGASG
jgi:AcrR family transcriptional regulator